MPASTKLAFAPFFAFALFIQASLGQVCICCVLETYTTRGRFAEYQCMMSDVKLAGHVETNECVTACGVERTSVGMGSDSLLEPTFLAKLCSPECYHNCDNIVDLYFNLAAGEGAFLPNICKAQGSHHRYMMELVSSSAAEK